MRTNIFVLLILFLSNTTLAKSISVFENNNLKIHDLNTVAELKKAEHTLKQFEVTANKQLKDLDAKSEIEFNENKVNQLLSAYKLKLNTFLYRVKIGEIALNDIKQEIIRKKVESIILLEQNEVEVLNEELKAINDTMLEKDKRIEALSMELQQANNNLLEARLQSASAVTSLSASLQKKLSECQISKADSEELTVEKPISQDIYEQPRITVDNIILKSSFITSKSAKIVFNFDYSIFIPPASLGENANTRFIDKSGTVESTMLNSSNTTPKAIYLGNGIYIHASIKNNSELIIAHKKVPLAILPL